ncbi:MAG: LysM peptidoglycan-binding domain-containing protein [Halothiobacillus sp.]|jgi:pilus assembly protein FimV|nr:LysM peptidoglycan-binding domain-containing protein [Halothiobacillus sp.]
MRKLSWIIAGILCTTPVTLMAAELGAAKLESHLTERLKVIIPISGLNGTPLDEVKVSLAPEHFYDQAGLSMDSLAGNIMFQIKPGAKGPYVLVSSKRSISDPILSMLLEIKTTNGHFIKEYDLLLNPPVRADSFRTATQKPSITQQSVQQAATNSSRPVIPNSTPSTPTWTTVKDVPDVKMDEQYKVKRGDTLYDIAKQSAAKSKVAVRPMMQAIINANPKAFVDGNGNSLMAGAVLKVPGGAANAASAPTQTAKTTQDETVTPPAVETGTETQPKLQLLSPDSEPATQANTASQNTTNTTTSSDTTTANGQPKLSAIDTPSEDQSAATAQQNNEAIASIDAKSEAMSQQINLLNTQLKQVQDQIQVRNQNIDLLQKKIHNSESQTKTLQQQLEEQKNSFWIQWGPYLAGGVGLLIIVLLLLLMARGRRDRDTYEARSTELKTPMPPLANIENDAEKTLNSPTTEAHKFSSAAPTLTAAAGMAVIPAFNAQTLIEESRLLVSYNLHPQAVEMLQDAVSDHPDELPLYQELARIHAEAKNETSLSDILGEIDHRFGPDKRPDMSDIQQHISLQSAPIPIFEQKVSSADSQVPPPQLKTSTTDPVETLEILDINTQKDETNDIEFSLEDLNPAHDSAAPRSLNLDLPPSTIDDENLDTLDLPRRKYEGIQTDEGGDIQAQGEKNNDTRLGLVEAFLGVGDMESYRMIAEEIEGEGDSELISSLRNIEKAHGV